MGLEKRYRKKEIPEKRRQKEKLKFNYMLIGSLIISKQKLNVVVYFSHLLI